MHGEPQRQTFIVCVDGPAAGAQLVVEADRLRRPLQQEYLVAKLLRPTKVVVLDPASGPEVEGQARAQRAQWHVYGPVPDAEVEDGAPWPLRFVRSRRRL